MTAIWLAVGVAVFLAAVVLAVAVRTMRHGLAPKPPRQAASAPRQVEKPPSDTVAALAAPPPAVPAPQWRGGFAAPAPVEPVTPGQADNSLAWLLVAIPILLPLALAAAYLSKVNVSSDMTLLLTVVATALVAGFDERLLRHRGFEVPSGLLVLLVPWYLVKRARHTGQTYALPVAWVVAALVGLAGGAAIDKFLGPVPLDTPSLESFLKTQAGLDTVCPARSAYWIHDVVFCQEGAKQVRVEVVNHDGAFTYTILN